MIKKSILPWRIPPDSSLSAALLLLFRNEKKSLNQKMSRFRVPIPYLQNLSTLFSMSYVDKFCRVGEFHSHHHYTALLWIGNCLPSSVRNMQSDVNKYVISACGWATLCIKKQLGNCQQKSPRCITHRGLKEFIYLIFMCHENSQNQISDTLESSFPNSWMAFSISSSRFALGFLLPETYWRISEGLIPIRLASGVIDMGNLSKKAQMSYLKDISSSGIARPISLYSSLATRRSLTAASTVEP